MTVATMTTQRKADLVFHTIWIIPAILFAIPLLAWLFG